MPSASSSVGNCIFSYTLLSSGGTGDCQGRSIGGREPWGGGGGREEEREEGIERVGEKRGGEEKEKKGRRKRRKRKKRKKKRKVGRIVRTLYSKMEKFTPRQAYLANNLFFQRAEGLKELVSLHLAHHY